MKPILLLYVPCSDTPQAQRLAHMLLKQNLVACVNILPSSSMYWWQEKITQENEVILLIKTLPEKALPITHLIEEQHSYDIACIMHVPVHVNEKYFDWMLEQIKTK